MTTPPVSDEVVRASWEAYNACGNKTQAALDLKIPISTFRGHIQMAIKRGFHLSDGVSHIVETARMSPAEAKGGWVHTYDQDGKKIGATRWAVSEDNGEPDEWVQAILDGLSGIVAAPATPGPPQVSSELCNVLPLFDVHWGMHAWAKETGHHDYDLSLATSDMQNSIESILAVTPTAKVCVLIIGGDFFHADDDRNETPASKHNLDMDGRQFKVIQRAIEVLTWTVSRLLACHEKVVIRVLRGNHDRNSHRILTFTLAAYFRNDNVEIDMNPRDLFMYQWGRCAIFAHHGDRMKPEDFVLKLADVCDFWSSTKHRHAYTGHLHRFEAKRIGGVNYERLEPFAPPDEYGSQFVNRRQINMDTYHAIKGRVNRATDPIER